jgi:threonine synthase
MIGNPVSMPRVIELVNHYNRRAGKQRVFFVEVSEQQIMDWQLIANRNGHIACTHGGESLAGLVAARHQGLLETDDIAVVDSTAHALKFVGFQQMYFETGFSPEFGITPDPDFINAPVYVRPADLEKIPEPGRPLAGEVLQHFVRRISEEIAAALNLKKVQQG